MASNEQEHPGGPRLLLTGDVMTGRGIDQVLPHPAEPRLYERWAKSAMRYVELAEAANGPIPRPVDFDYIWGDAISSVAHRRPDLRIVNLETSITRSTTPAPKGINYKMDPRNIGCLTAFGIDCCVLANNHVADWGPSGLIETITDLRAAGIVPAGAGRDAEEAWAPAILPFSGGRLIVLALGSDSSGIPRSWAARAERPGVALLSDFTDRSLEAVAAVIGRVKRPGDLALVSIHWGGNWGYTISAEQRRFAQGLTRSAGVDLVHGHSSHHPRGLEVHEGKLILYGCGDFLNDYEGIGGEEKYRPDLTLAYLPELDPATGNLTNLAMLPFHVAKFQLHTAKAEEADWLAATLTRQGQALGTRVDHAAGVLRLSWS
ncbi:CapA family protein [Dongia sedimenti]|uniref:CapA family protein n=1 Tax=Dongia sedimenti TaxID=3064282 RepID=A0ABU0YTJ9_9PROT|nr:CapA family protein [Rhodospirillaceae bacterium R-7]